MAIDGSSPLRRFEPHVSVFCDRLEDLVSPGSIESLTPETLANRVGEYADLIAGYHAANGGWSIVHRFCAPDPSVDDGTGDWPARIDEMNAIFAPAAGRPDTTPLGRRGCGSRREREAGG